MRCKGVTQQGKQCSNNQNDYFCRYHKKYIAEKPTECSICLEELSDDDILECGHWVHVNCIKQQSKAECPFCRCELKTLSVDVMQQINKNFMKVQEENLQQEFDELFNDEMENLMLQFNIISITYVCDNCIEANT